MAAALPSGDITVSAPTGLRPWPDNRCHAGLLQLRVTGPPVEIRPATESDDSEVLRLLSTTLGWKHDRDHQALFNWKHRHNLFGPSLAWVAVTDARVVGFRAFMRWQFQLGALRVEAVRPVDTATDPGYRRRGVFSELTRHGIDESRRAGMAFVFNTPNTQSGPGYLKMGWQPVGRVRVGVALRHPGVVIRTGRAHRPADLWSLATSAGLSAEEALSDGAAIDELLAGQPSTGGHLATERSKEYLRWRYASGPLGYRAVVAGPSARDGVAFWRLRPRGPSLEVAIGDVLAPGGDRRVIKALVRSVLRTTRADHALAVGLPMGLRGRLIATAKLGPQLIWRGLDMTEPPRLALWDLSLGDIEPF